MTGREFRYQQREKEIREIRKLDRENPDRFRPELDYKEISTGSLRWDKVTIVFPKNMIILEPASAL